MLDKAIFDIWFDLIILINFRYFERLTTIFKYLIEKLEFKEEEKKGKW